MRFNDEIKEQIRDKIDIVDLVGKYMPLKRQGRSFVGLCPWHDDKKPSFMVNPDRQSFKCWVCDIGGDIFSFVMKMENVDFPGAMEILADMAGLDYQRKQPRTPKYGDTNSYNSAHAHHESEPEPVHAHGSSNEIVPDKNQSGSDVSFVQAAPINQLSPAVRRNDSPYEGAIASEDDSYEPYVPEDMAPVRRNADHRSNWNRSSATGPLAEQAEQSGLAEQAGQVEQRYQPTDSSQIPDSSQVQDPNKRVNVRQTLFRVLNWVEKQYSESLIYDPSQRALEYLRRRGITDVSIQKFKLGYCPEPRNWLANKVNNVPSRLQWLIEAGILSKGEYGGLYDRFRDRVMFPIHDAMGHCIAFGGRMMDDTTVKSKAKYINSPETPIFSKRKQLYGLDLAKQTMVKTRRALVMEGYMDCIVAHQFGFTDAVAVLGTALGSKHIETLRHYVDRVVLILDGDTAGRKRAGEVLELFVSENMDLQVVTLPQVPAPDGSIPKDPAEYLLAWGADALNFLIENESKSALDHAYEIYTQGVDLKNDIHGAEQALYQMLELLAKIPHDVVPIGRGRKTDSLFREHQIILKLAMRFHLDEDEVKVRIKDIRARQAARGSRYRQDDEDSDEQEAAIQEQDLTAIPPEWGTENPFERELMELLFVFPYMWPTVAQHVARNDLHFYPAQSSFDWIHTFALQGMEFSCEALIANFADPRLKRWAAEVWESGVAKAIQDPYPLFEEWLIRFKRYLIERQRMEQTELILNSAQRDEQTRRNAWTAVLNHIKVRHGVTGSTDGDGCGASENGNPFG